MLRALFNTTAVIAASIALAAPVAAQTAPVTPATPAPTAAQAAAAQQADASAALPPALTALGITDATVTAGRKGGQRVQGTLPGGLAFRGALDDQGKLRMIRTDGGAGLPAGVSDRLVPQAVRAAPIFAEFAKVEGVAQGDSGIMVFGTDKQGQSLRAAFSADGLMQKFGRGEDRASHRDGQSRHKKSWGESDERGPRNADGPRGGGGPGADDRGHGKGMKGDRQGNRGGRGADQPGQGPQAGSGPEANPRGAASPGQGQQGQGPQGQGGQPTLDDGAVRTILSEGGYTDVGAITRNGARTEVEAVNPEGENVTVTVSPRGMVVRELAR